MEWHFGGGNVAKDEGTPGYLLPQGRSKLENCGLPNKYCIQAKESTIDELSFNRESSIYELNKEEPHGWTAWGEFPFADWSCGNQEASLQRNEPLGDRMDYQLDGLKEINQMDDIFLRSIQEGDPMDMQNPYRAVGIVPESECSTISLDDFSTDMITESQSILMEPTDMDMLKYFGNCDFSQSEVWENFEDDEPNLMISDSEQKKFPMETKAPITTAKTTDELNTSCEEAEHVEIETSLEARVLRQLEVVMAKMPQNTRICFRDALYRLAKCSKQSHLPIHGQSEEVSSGIHPTIYDEASRSGQVQPMESETNAIDRTIANLMFNTLNCNETDLSSIASLNLSDEAYTEEKPHVYSSKTSKVTPYHSPAMSYDAEVPIW